MNYYEEAVMRLEPARTTDVDLLNRMHVREPHMGDGTSDLVLKDAIELIHRLYSRIGKPVEQQPVPVSYEFLQNLVREAARLLTGFSAAKGWLERVKFAGLYEPLAAQIDGVSGSAIQAGEDVACFIDGKWYPMAGGLLALNSACGPNQPIRVHVDRMSSTFATATAVEKHFHKAQAAKDLSDCLASEQVREQADKVRKAKCEHGQEGYCFKCATGVDCDGGVQARHVQS